MNLNNKLQINDAFSNIHIDNIDFKILEILGSEYKNTKQIAAEVKVPLRTIQRKTKKLTETGIVNVKVELDYKKMGFKKGWLYVYLKGGKIKQIAEKLSSMYGMLSVSVQIGNSDIVCHFIYKDIRQVLDLISEAYRWQGVDRIIWSEEVYTMAVRKKYIVSR
jgi:DNA-binding Lrp family transcriptional regulator